MKKLFRLTLWASFLGLFILASCGGSGGGTDEPQPVSLTFVTTSATFNGSNIDPAPDYRLTVNFDADGDPNGYSIAGTADKRPTVGTSGDFSISGNTVTFTSGQQERTVTIRGGSLSTTSASVRLEWELTKVDDNVTAEEQGTYLYVLEVQE